MLSKRAAGECSTEYKKTDESKLSRQKNNNKKNCFQCYHMHSIKLSDFLEVVSYAITKENKNSFS